MRQLNALKNPIQFDLKTLLNGWTLELQSVSEWKEFETEKIIGTKYNVIITNDTIRKDGYDEQANRYQRFALKVRKIDAKSYPVGTIVVPRGITKAITWGDYQNNISIECEAVISLDEYKRMAGR